MLATLILTYVLAQAPAAKELSTPTVFGDLKLGSKFQNSVGQQFVYLPPGTFLMGSETDRVPGEGEGGTHTVELTEGFFVAIHETTQEHYQKVTGETPWKGKRYVREGADYPATSVSWDDANDKFIKRLNETERSAGMLPPGWEYRLLTEAQYEYAARAGTKTQFSYGDDESQLSKYAWYVANSWDAGEKYAHRVGQKLANQWGLFDMMGNVNEWTADYYGDYPPGKVTNPIGPNGGSTRVFRGGSWMNFASHCLPAARNGNSSDYRFDNLGFRVALVQSSRQ